MNNEENAAAPDDGRTDIVFVLLVLQAGFGIVSALGALVYSRLGGGGAGMVIALFLGFGVPLALLVLAGGIVACRRWARIAVAGFEGLVLLGAAARLLVGRSMALNLVMLLTTIALPLTVTVLLFAGRKRPHPVPSPLLRNREGDHCLPDASGEDRRVGVMPEPLRRRERTVAYRRPQTHLSSPCVQRGHVSTDTSPLMPLILELCAMQPMIALSIAKQWRGEGVR